MSSAHLKPEIDLGVIIIPVDRYFPEGVTVAQDGTFYVGSMEAGCIFRVPPGAQEAEPFIQAGANGLVSVLGVYADDARATLWACSSDAGNGKLTGSAPVGVKAFDLKTGQAKGSYDFPGGGFANDLTIDDQGNLYVTDSWTPRILRLPAGGSKLEEWINHPQLGVEQWSLNGIDFDRESQGMQSLCGAIYTVNQRAGQLFRIEINPDGSAGAVTLIHTSQPLRRPDGLKLIAPHTLATSEGGAGGIAVIQVAGDTAQVTRVSEGLDCVTTFAFYRGSAWVVEGQANHFWDPANAGPDATPPFRIVEVPLKYQMTNIK
jgi:sugar lactone lactonase YvrE